MYDSPEHKVSIDPIVVKGDHAVADWVQQGKGGRVVLLRNPIGQWDIVLCSGKAVKNSGFLMEAGVPQSDAEFLAKELALAEANVSNEKVVLFDSFNGIMRTSH